MDARPHRPLRTMRTFNDENVIVTGPLPKTIHQRNKSSPALANLNTGTALKAAAKRTAFGDVSNVVNVSRSSKQDVNGLLKPTSQGTVDAVSISYEKKTAAFHRPAQRPLSVSNLRNILTGSHHTASSTDFQPKPTGVEASISLSVSNTRKILSKRATTVFKDSHLEPVQESEFSDPEKKQLPKDAVHVDDVPTQVAIPPPDSQLYLAPPEAHSTIEPVKEGQPVLQESLSPEKSSLPVVDPVTQSERHVTDIVKSTNNDHIAAPYEAVPSYISQLANALIEPIKKDCVSVNQQEIAAKPIPPPHQTLSELINAPIAADLMKIPTRPEPEEYWEEDEEDVYEEDAYVTARSFRSKGDNTTGGVTTVLVPRMNHKVRREIEAATKLVEATRTLEEIEDEAYDTSMVAEYGDEIFEYMRQLEIKMSPNPHYMDNQHEIQWSMRSVLMDWLVQVHHRFNLLPETLFLCVNYIDRFLSCKVVSLGKLQLVGATAIFIAAKYEEINCPSVQEIVYMVDGGYSIDEILKAERFMLTMLQFELGWPGPMSFLRRISKADDYDLETRTLAKYFLEVTLMDERFIGSPPSFTAAASHCLARLMLRKGSWTSHHIYYSGYTYSQLRPLVQLLLDCCEEPRKHHSAVYNKYCDKRYKRASAFVENEIARGFILPQSPIANSQVQPVIYSYYANGQYFGL